jgi:hypothetical protein
VGLLTSGSTVFNCNASNTIPSGAGDSPSYSSAALNSSYTLTSSNASSVP